MDVVSCENKDRAVTSFPSEVLTTTGTVFRSEKHPASCGFSLSATFEHFAAGGFEDHRQWKWLVLAAIVLRFQEQGRCSIAGSPKAANVRPEG
jgi:hypothetical protein